MTWSTGPWGEPRLPRVDRWLQRDGNRLGPLTYDGAWLIDQRLVVLRRARLVCLGYLPVLVVGLVELGLAGVRASVPTELGATLPALALAGAAVTADLVIREGERDIAERAGIALVAAPRRRIPIVWPIAVVIVIAGLVLTLVSLATSGRAAVDWVVPMIVGGLLVALAAWSAHSYTRRPVLAVDQGSYEADRRLSQLTFAFYVFALGWLGYEASTLAIFGTPRASMLGLAGENAFAVSMIMVNIARASRGRSPEVVARVPR